jgi:sulfate/thiosulfate-binding protein
MRRIYRAVAIAALAISGAASAATVTLLNVSYDPTRELYKAINTGFAADWKAKTGDTVVINQSHGGSGKQARSVIDGLDADVVTLALAYDIDEIADKAKLLPTDWQKRLAHNSTPYSSTIVFLVRKGNPKNIRDWDDLVKPGVSIITPNPKTSGGARWNYLAAWGYAQKKYGNAAAARDFVTKIFKNVAVLDSGARGSTTTFVQRGQGDVLLAWENEAYLSQKDAPGEYVIVTPSVSVKAEPPVALVDKNVDKKGTRKVAEAYLKYLYTPAAQAVIGENYYRPIDAAAAKKYSANFPKLALFTIDRNFGGWKKAQAVHFADGGIFDQIFDAAKR